MFFYLSVCLCWLGAKERVKIQPSRARSSRGDTLIRGDQGEMLVLLLCIGVCGLNTPSESSLTAALPQTLS